MDKNGLIEPFSDKDRQLFGHQPIHLKHKLVESGLFTEDALAEVINELPRSHYNINTMGYDHDNPEWKEGHLAGHSGHDVIDAIRRGRMWLNLRLLEEVDPRYKTLLDSIFEQFEDEIDDLKTFKRSLGVLISSPKVRIFYHADVPGQSLWQISGKKRIYLYPNTEPFLKPEDMEGVVLGMTEEEIPYEDWYDEFATVYDLEAGDMLHWPLNGPHQVINEDCLNISVTTAYWTKAIRNTYAVNYANGVLRNTFGYTPRSNHISDISLYPKAALTFLWKKFNLQKNKQVDKTIQFEIDPDSPTGITLI